MPPIRVVTDSGADLTEAEARELGVTIVSLIVNFGGETYLDEELDIETFWQKTAIVHPQTSQPPVGAFEQVFQTLTGAGAEVLCITITSKHSGTYNSAWTAAQRFGDKVTVFDSESLSLGQAYQVQAAVAAARENKAMAEIIPILEDIRKRSRIFILLDTIEYLKKGGRAAKFISVVEKVVRLFNIKPILTMPEGELKLLGTTNSFTRGLLRMEREVLALAPLERWAVLYTRNREAAERFAQNLAPKLGLSAQDVPVVETGAILSSHAGPGVVATIALPKADSR